MTGINSRNFRGHSCRSVSMHTRFILLQTSHAGNVGAVARAMKVMGFDDLVLVQPRWHDVLQREEAIERASGADDVLRKARIVQTWEEAVEGIEHLCATAMTPRDFGPPTVEPRPHFAQLVAMNQAKAARSTEPGDELLAADTGAPVAAQAHLQASSAATEAPPLRSLGLVFGSERYGMRNEEVYRCHACLSIPTNPDYGSLNIAAAAQVLAYEWRMALGGFGQGATSAPPSTEQRAYAAEVEGMLAHWEQALIHVGYLDPEAPKKLMPRLQQLFHRATLRQEEIHILRGIARAMQKTTHIPKP